ncbi:PREDICTED: CMRF35-like molecule 8, partial [Leptosomus discolor]|uniref:CMRF35-like molecule 8 n=1 Tax=Leptosomus discolor TaxID=188344 RepID=UPI0005226482
CVSAGCWAVTGPGTVRGVLGGSLSVTCTYRAGHERKPKFWCIPGRVHTCDADIVITSEWRPEVRRGRFSIRDDRARQEFTVTVEGLTMGDAGMFRCGVRTGIFQLDESDDVMVIVFPALSGAAVEMDWTRSVSHTGADTLNYADINHRASTAESQLYSNAEAVRCLANTTTEYTELKA